MSRLVKVVFCAVALSGFFMVNDADAGLFGRRGNDCSGVSNDCCGNSNGGGGLFGHKRGNDCGGGRGGLFGKKRGNDCGCPQPVCCEPAPVCCPQPEPVCCPQPTCCEAPAASCGCGSSASYGYASSDCGCSSSNVSYGNSYGSPVYYGGATSGCANCGTTMDAGMIQSGSSIPPAPMADPNANVPAAPSPSDVPSA